MGGFNKTLFLLPEERYTYCQKIRFCRMCPLFVQQLIIMYDEVKSPNVDSHQLITKITQNNNMMCHMPQDPNNTDDYMTPKQ